MNQKAGVLLSAHGTIDHVDQTADFLRNIRRGRPTPPEMVEEVRRRFIEIGGSPLLKTTREVANALEARVGVPVVVGMLRWHPYIAEALDEVVARGIETLVSLPLAPQSVHIYHGALREAVNARRAGGGRVPEVIEVEPWGQEPALIDAFVEVIGEGLARFANAREVALVLSAHSLPLRALAAGDPYETQFRAMADVVAGRVRERVRTVRVAYQSQGMDGGDWLGPDLPTTFRQLAVEGMREVLVAPIGFVSDHVETLYDLDVDAVRLAKAAGLVRYERAPSLNTRPTYLSALTSVAARSLGPAPGG